MAALPRLLTTAVLAAALAGCSGGDARTDQSAPATTAGQVVATVERVVDGDTVVVDIEGSEERLRLIGIDTPESVKPDTPVECFGQEASDFTKGLLPEGTQVSLERDVEARDDYGRLLVYVTRVADGMFVNLEIMEQGYARPLTIPPNVAHVDDFVAAARRAEQANTGLWAACRG